jgi:hypothetical protein
MKILQVIPYFSYMYGGTVRVVAPRRYLILSSSRLSIRASLRGKLTWQTDLKLVSSLTQQS